MDHPNPVTRLFFRQAMDGGRSVSGTAARRAVARDRWQRAAARIRARRRAPARVPFMARRATTNVPVGVPDSKIVRLRYSTLQVLDPTLSAAAVRVFSANGAYDPDITGVGHQPLWFDQWMTMYNHYHCYQSTIKVTFASGTTTIAANYVVGVHLSDTSSTDTTQDPPFYCEQQNTTWKVISNSYSQPQNTVVATADNAAFFRMSKANYLADDEFKGNNSANPNEGTYWHVFCTPLKAGVNLEEVQMIVEIEYECKLTEVKPISAS